MVLYSMIHKILKMLQKINGVNPVFHHGKYIIFRNWIQKQFVVSINSTTENGTFI
jgi:hypothetical protein